MFSIHFFSFLAHINMAPHLRVINAVLWTMLSAVLHTQITKKQTREIQKYAFFKMMLFLEIYLWMVLEMRHYPRESFDHRLRFAFRNVSYSI